MATKKEWDDKVSLVDSQIQDPVQRAKKVYDLLKEHSDLTDWDLVCFSSEFLGMMSMGPLPYLENAIKPVSKLVYMQHYFQTDEIVVGPVKGSFHEIMMKEKLGNKKTEEPKLSKIRIIND